MRIITFSGIQPNAMVVTGLDLTAENIGNATDDNFFKKNTDKENKFPGGPMCEFKGKYIPCLCRWSKKGSITAEILTYILSTIDHMKVFNGKNGAIPLLLIDGHMLRMDMELLEYIYNHADEWAVVIRVPCGTALWQV